MTRDPEQEASPRKVLFPWHAPNPEAQRLSTGCLASALHIFDDHGRKRAILSHAGAAASSAVRASASLRRWTGETNDAVTGSGARSGRRYYSKDPRTDELDANRRCCEFAAIWRTCSATVAIHGV